MMKRLSILGAVMLSPLALYAAVSPVSSGSGLPQAGFFLGLGGSYNSIKLNQNLYASGISNVYADGSLTSAGQAGGPANPYANTQSTFAPLAQLGYFRNFGNSDWLWGAKFSYQYLGTTDTDSNVIVPQAGTFTNVSSSNTFTGHVTIGSSQTSVNNELNFIPFIGHSFANSFVYLGVGPTVFGTQSKINSATGYADINGVHYDITGTSSNYSSSKWVWGGAAQVGMDYYFQPTWSIDVNYTFAVTPYYKTNYSGPFSTSYVSGGTTYTDTGTLYTNTSQRILEQAVAISINKTF